MPNSALQETTVTILDKVLEFYCYIDITDFETKVQALVPYFRAMEPVHLRAVWPIFVMELKPGGRPQGGTWKPADVASNFLSSGQVRNTGIPAEDIQSLVIDRGLGLIGIPRNRWARPERRLKFTVLHEVGHNIDFCFQPGGLVPGGAGPDDFPGMNTSACGSGNHMVRRAVEAYSNSICRPTQIYHDLPHGMTAHACNRQLLETLHRSAAFRAVTTTP